MLHRVKINKQKFNNSLRTSCYHHNLIFFPNMGCEMLIESFDALLKSRKENKKKNKNQMQRLFKPQIT